MGASARLASAMGNASIDESRSTERVPGSALRWWGLAMRFSMVERKISGNTRRPWRDVAAPNAPRPGHSWPGVLACRSDASARAASDRFGPWQQGSDSATGRHLNTSYRSVAGENVQFVPVRMRWPHFFEQVVKVYFGAIYSALTASADSPPARAAFAGGRGQALDSKPSYPASTTAWQRSRYNGCPPV